MIFFGQMKAGDTVSVRPAKAFVPESGIRIPSENRINEILKDKKYDYGDFYKPPAKTGILARLLRWIAKMIGLGMKAFSYWPVAFRILVIVVLIILIYVIATKTKLYRLFYFEKQKENPYFREINLPDEFDFEKAISEAIALNHFKDAIRFSHLKLLKNLNDNRKIQLSVDKTNRDYSFEIRDNLMREKFLRLTEIYNRVWYGEYIMSKPELDSVLPEFAEFNAG
jgi:tRNA nucleotidyltransferase/poly(A) polymerase